MGRPSHDSVMANRDLEAALRRMYDEYGKRGAADITFFGEFWDELRRYEAADIVAFLSRQYAPSFVSSFLLSMPELLRLMTSEDWLNTIARAGPRRPLVPSEIQNGPARRHLGLNAVQVALESDLVSPEDGRHRTARAIGPSGQLEPPSFEN